MSVIMIARQLKWELSNPHQRFHWLAWISRTIPGDIGIDIRRRWGRYFQNCGTNLMIHPGVTIRSQHRLSVGNNVSLGEGAFLQAGGGLELGHNVAMGPGVKIWTMNHKFGRCGPVNDNDYEYKNVKIGNDVWIAANAFIMPGAEIQDGVIISACSVVGAKTYPPYSIIAGHPARVVKLR